MVVILNLTGKEILIEANNCHQQKASIVDAEIFIDLTFVLLVKME